MKILIITGSCGLVGSACVQANSDKYDLIVGIDNNERGSLFGEEASTHKTLDFLEKNVSNYRHHYVDITKNKALRDVFLKYLTDIKGIIHTAGQPSHDLSAKLPHRDFQVNALGTLNLLEAIRTFCPDAPITFTSTNKVYGDRINHTTFIEEETRYSPSWENPYKHGIDENMPIDSSMHSPFGISKISADTLVQEYGRYFGLKTASFRCGCITGKNHMGVKLHGFLSFLVKTALTNETYQIIGYKGKQVRDNIHAYDLATAMNCYLENPKENGIVFNMGGGSYCNSSVLETITILENIIDRKINKTFENKAREGDHKWWITDTTKFEQYYPEWQRKYQNIQQILESLI